VCVQNQIAPTCGEKSYEPKNNKQAARDYLPKLCGTFIKRVETLRRSVNKNTDAPSDAEITSARHEFDLPEIERR